MAINVPPNYYDSDGKVPSLRAEQITVPLVPVLILPNQLSRLRANIQNVGANVVYIGPDSTVTTANGYKVGTASVIGINSTAEVWAVAAVAASVVCILTEQLMSSG